MGYKVLSLFDGISCGRVALERAGIDVESYTAYEIEERAIKIAAYNFPSTKHKGNVFDAKYEYGQFDLLVGGSPCTHWSIAQKAGDRETSASGLGWDLFSQYNRARLETGVKYFIYENNYSMSKEIKAAITETFGVEPIYINSSLVSGQMRKRLYWTNIPGVTVPEDRGITLQSILESGTVDREKSLCLARRYAGFDGSQGYLCRRYFGKSFGQAAFEGSISDIKAMWKEDPYFESDDKNIRQLTPLECERLQTLPDGYTDVPGVTKQNRYEGIGNGWTVDVIAHILSFMPKDVDNK